MNTKEMLIANAEKTLANLEKQKRLLEEKLQDIKDIDWSKFDRHEITYVYVTEYEIFIDTKGTELDTTRLAEKFGSNDLKWNTEFGGVWIMTFPHKWLKIVLYVYPNETCEFIYEEQVKKVPVGVKCQPIEVE